MNHRFLINWRSRSSATRKCYSQSSEERSVEHDPVSSVKRNFRLAKFLTSLHVRVHKVIFCISNILRKLVI